jgi:hypothetical protein
MLNGVFDDAAPALGMWGGPPPEKLVWYGYGRGPNLLDVERVEAARTSGVWLRLSFTLRLVASRPRGWNTAASLLRLLEPRHRLPEDAATRQLVELIEAHAQRLDWPAVLLAGEPAVHRAGAVALDHPLTAFVAIAKATGSLWLRSRSPRLSALQCPRIVERPTLASPHAEWEQVLWFPDGLPPGLLQQALDDAMRLRGAATGTTSP